jgi:superfamily I DNA and/or RNA helicase
MINLDEMYKSLEKSLVSELLSDRKLALVQAPPGSGKTHMLLTVVAQLVRAGKCVALAAQTNRQADDIAHRWSKDYSNLPAIRLGSRSSVAPADFPPTIYWETDANSLGREPGLYISTTAKWTTVRDPEPFDLLAVDEAWQMAWADLMQCANLSEKFYLIGDPGQIPPVVTIDVRRWQTAPRPPHKPAPEVVIGDPDLLKTAFVGALPACRRLPFESVEFVKPFYSFDFHAYAKPGERKIVFNNLQANHPMAKLFANLETSQPAIATLPTPEDGPALEVDSELAIKVTQIIDALLESETEIDLGDGISRKLLPTDIGVCATHRSMNGEMSRNLSPLSSGVSVDTPERWQGLQRPIMIVVHPLSSVIDPSDFDLETGRLCVMASRHQVSLIVVTRDHVGETLSGFIPEASQAPGQPDVVGRGHAAHSHFWNALQKANRIFQID